MAASAPPLRPTASGSRPVTRWLTCAVALTLVDAVATGAWLHLEIATEANPLLVTLIETVGLVPAMIVRAGVGAGLLLALAALRDRSRLARLALPVLTVALGAVAAWHALGATAIVAAVVT